jgi:4'-phosphopantetheinyl transferase EntD
MFRFGAIFGLLAAATLVLGGCANSYNLPSFYTPEVPKECSQVLGFEVKELPKGKSNAAAVSVELAKEGAVRQEEHSISKVCARHALRTGGIADAETPKALKGGVNKD